MAQSFLNTPGLPLGLRNNNPGNLRPLPGGQKWVGEIDRDAVNNFSRFSDVAYGLRAMITDITGDIVNDRLNTIRKLANQYAPPSENDTAAYINAVAQYSGIPADAILKPNRDTVEKLIRAKLKVELGPQYAAKLSQQDINEGFDRLGTTVQKWLSMAVSSTGGQLLLTVAAGCLIYRYRKKLFK